MKDRVYYEIRYDGGGDFDFHILDPENEELPYDCTDVDDVVATAKEAPEIIGHPVYIVEITEKIIA